jgi:hypothetical protein
LSVATLYKWIKSTAKQVESLLTRCRISGPTDMTYTENLWLFFTLLFGIIILPGVDMLFVLASSLTGGRRVGLAATSGITAGGVVHSLYGAVGVGLLASLVPVLFTPLLVLGAAYMMWIGVSLMRSSITVDTDDVSASSSVWRAFRRHAHLPHQSQGVSLHARGLSAVFESRLWSDLASGTDYGVDDGGNAACRLRRAGAHRRQKP